jgi:ATP-dependent protease ClpP protease subunit
MRRTSSKPHIYKMVSDLAINHSIAQLFKIQSNSIIENIYIYIYIYIYINNSNYRSAQTVIIDGY